MSVSSTYQNYTVKWFTPPEWLAWVNDTFMENGWFPGVQPYDPCPANWVDGDPSGLDYPWDDLFPVYCNHPGSRGSTKAWWGKFLESECITDVIWCAFSIEQLRHMDPSPFDMAGWLVMPKKRISFISAETGLPGKSPANWSVFWTNVRPAAPPVDCVIVRTGCS